MVLPANLREVMTSATRGLVLPVFDISSLIPRAAVDLGSLLDNWRRAVAPFLEATAEYFGRVQDSLPANWLELDDTPLDEVALLSKDTGWPLTWVPRAAVLRELLEVSADSDGTRNRGTLEGVLMERKQEVLEDVLCVANEIDHPDLREVVPFITEAVGQLRRGEFRGPQAALGSVLTHLIERTLAYGKSSAAKADLAVDPLAVRLLEIRVACLSNAVVAAFASFGDGSVPVVFARHAVAHTIAPEQYSEVNALVGMMLVCSLARELQEQFNISGELTLPAFNVDE